jgi:HEAT repeat protein
MKGSLRKKAVASLAKKLNSRSAFERASAAEQLGVIGTRSAISLLENHLCDASPEVRMRVVEGSVESKDRSGRALLRRLRIAMNLFVLKPRNRSEPNTMAVLRRYFDGH